MQGNLALANESQALLTISISIMICHFSSSSASWVLQVCTLHISVHLSHCWGMYTETVCRLVDTCGRATARQYLVLGSHASIQWPIDHLYLLSIHSSWGLVQRDDFVNTAPDGSLVIGMEGMHGQTVLTGGSWLDSSSPRLAQHLVSELVHFCGVDCRYIHVAGDLLQLLKEIWGNIPWTNQLTKSLLVGLL